MSYQQLEEPVFVCLKCNKEYSMNNAKVQFGLFEDSNLVRCADCFEKLKHGFWLRIMAEER